MSISYWLETMLSFFYRITAKKTIANQDTNSAHSCYVIEKKKKKEREIEINIRWSGREVGVEKDAILFLIFNQNSCR
jgi:hypothetical protein